MAASRKRPRRGKVLPVPRRSGRLYLSIEPSRVGMFRFLLEAADNLALMSVVDRFGAVLQIRFSPHQEREVRSFLLGMRERLPFEEIPLRGVLEPFSRGSTPDPAGGNDSPRPPSYVGGLRGAKTAHNGGAGESIPCRGGRGAEPPGKNGALVYVMGPSGSGKDSLLREAARNLAGEAGIVFVRRYITRPAEAGGEDHIAVSPAEFAIKRAAGFFALDWESHGLSYGIAAEDIAPVLKQGRTVVLNGSREYLPEATRRCPELIPILIEVSPEALRQRLLARGRETPEQIEARLARSIQARPDPAGLIRLDNSGDLEEAARTFTNHLQTLAGV